jgi:serine/threonine protein kinase
MNDAPRVIDNFTIIRRLGAGAMGEVFLAQESLTNRTVALKLMAPALAGSEPHVKRFEREIHVLSQLEHPNIAGYLGNGIWQGVPYLATEFIPGATLGDFIRGGKRMDEAVVLSIAIQVATGLGYAQQRCELVHRDLKPGNILAMSGASVPPSVDTVVKIIDFGLARARAAFDSLSYDLGGVGGGAVANASYEDAGERFQSIGQDDLGSAGGGGLTMAGQVMGTPYYMSPEQCHGAADLTLHSDIYSLGATLFHLLTARPPFIGRTPAMLLVGHISEPVPDPRQFIRTLSQPTADLIMRSLAKEPRGRFATYEQFIRVAQNALHALQSARAQAQAPVPQPSRHRPGDIEEILDEVAHAPQPLTGAEALRAVTTRFIRKNSSPATGAHRRTGGGDPPPAFRRPS